MNKKIKHVFFKRKTPGRNVAAAMVATMAVPGNTYNHRAVYRNCSNNKNFNTFFTVDVSLL